MARPPRNGSGGRSGRGRAFLLALLTPALFVAPLLGGRTGWVHSHGEAEAHVHLVPMQASSDEHGAHDAWHEVMHGDHGDAQESGHEQAPAGRALEVPPIHLASFAAGSAAAQRASFACAVVPFSVRSSDAIESRARPEPRRSGWPPPRAERSGVAALLRTSHALLI